MPSPRGTRPSESTAGGEIVFTEPQLFEPTIAAAVARAVYNIVDSYFVANMAENGELQSMPDTGISGADDDGGGRHRHRRGAMRIAGARSGRPRGAAAGYEPFGGIIYVVCLVVGRIGWGYIGSQNDPNRIWRRQDGSQYSPHPLHGSFGIFLFFAVVWRKMHPAGERSNNCTGAGALGRTSCFDPMAITGCPETGRGEAWATVLGQIALPLVLAAVRRSDAFALRAAVYLLIGVSAIMKASVDE